MRVTGPAVRGAGASDGGYYASPSSSAADMLSTAGHREISIGETSPALSAWEQDVSAGVDRRTGLRGVDFGGDRPWWR
jgi:hypothetical protein